MADAAAPPAAAPPVAAPAPLAAAAPPDVDQMAAQLAQMQAQLDSLNQQAVNRTPTMKPVTMPEKLTKDVSFPEWLQIFISMVSLMLPLASDQWLPFLLPNLPPQWQIALLAMLGVESQASLYGLGARRIAWSLVEPTLRRLYDQQNGTTPYNKKSAMWRLRYHGKTTLSDYYSKIASADLEAHGPLPSAADNQEYYFHRMEQRVAAFFNGLPNTLVNALCLNPTTRDYWCGSEWDDLGQAVIRHMANGLPSSDDAPSSSNWRKRSSEHAPTSQRPQKQISSQVPSPANKPTGKSGGGWDKSAPVKSYNPPQNLLMNGMPFVHSKQKQPLSADAKQWYYKNSICFVCGKCGHAPASCPNKAQGN